MRQRVVVPLWVIGLAIVGRADLMAQTSTAVSVMTPVRPPLLSVNEVKTVAAALTLTMLMDGVLREDIQERRSPVTNGVARVGNALGDPRYLVPVLGAGWLVGQATGSRTLGRAALRAGEAGVIASSMSGVMKFGLGRVRPLDGADMDRFRPLNSKGAFPSGHTTLAFAVATALARETPDRWSDVGFYGLASLTAFSRLNDDRHWTSDVVAGALLGYVVGRHIVPNRAGRQRDAQLVASPRGLGVSIGF